MEGKGFRDGIQDFADLDLVILGVSFDPVEDNRAFAEKFSFPFDLLSDTERGMGMDYHACDQPEDASAKRISYLIDRDGKIARAYALVVPQEHPAQVLNDLKEL